MSQAKQIIRHRSSRKRRANSAVTSVSMSGYDLVPHKKLPLDKIATMRDCAKMDFEPWTREPGTDPRKLLPSNEMMQDYAVSARLAYAIMFKTKPQLIEMHARIEHKTIDSLMADLLSTTERMKGLAVMLDAAYGRLLSAASAHQMAKGKFVMGGRKVRARG